MKTKITIIEDDDDLRSLMELSLQAAGYEVFTQSDGNFFMNKRDDISDLYIIDLNLGGASGIDLCKQIKAQKDSVKIPIVIIVSANPDLRELALEACADDTLPKPFSSKELLLKISENLPEQRTDLVNPISVP